MNPIKMMAPITNPNTVAHTIQNVRWLILSPHWGNFNSLLIAKIGTRFSALSILFSFYPLLSLFQCLTTHFSNIDNFLIRKYRNGVGFVKLANALQTCARILRGFFFTSITYSGTSRGDVIVLSPIWIAWYFRIHGEGCPCREDWSQHRNFLSIIWIHLITTIDLISKSTIFAGVFVQAVTDLFTIHIMSAWFAVFITKIDHSSWGRGHSLTTTIITRYSVPFFIVPKPTIFNAMLTHIIWARHDFGTITDWTNSKFPHNRPHDNSFYYSTDRG